MLHPMAARATAAAGARTALSASRSRSGRVDWLSGLSAGNTMIRNAASIATSTVIRASGRL